ncbi:MAG: HisA/HisF-related TIM barrel protein [Acidimicrobiales bacterium]
MQLYCAIDLRDGRAVRLVQGDFGKERGFGDPLEILDHYLDGGAKRLHVVDLDAARTGVPVNRAVVAEIVQRAGVPVQVSGGVRTAEDVATLLGLGADRVVMGTTALRDPEAARASVERHPGRVALGLDYRRGPGGGALRPAASGWEEQGGETVGEVLDAWAGQPLAAVVLTAIERDGTGTGPDLDGLGEVLDSCDHPVVASGGVGAVGDLESLCAFVSPKQGRRADGVVVGTALLEGRIGVREAVAACAPSG